MIRSAVWEVLSASAGVTDLVPAESIRAAGAAGMEGVTPDTPPSVARPFIVVRSMPDSRFNSGRTAVVGGVYVYVHDDPESYAGIDDIAAQVDIALLGLATPYAANAVPLRLNDIRLEGWSEDLYDDHYGTATRYGTFVIMASRVGSPGM